MPTDTEPVLGSSKEGSWIQSKGQKGARPTLNSSGTNRSIYNVQKEIVTYHQLGDAQSSSTCKISENIK